MYESDNEKGRCCVRVSQVCVPKGDVANAKARANTGRAREKEREREKERARRTDKECERICPPDDGLHRIRFFYPLYLCLRSREIRRSSAHIRI